MSSDDKTLPAELSVTTADVDTRATTGRPPLAPPEASGHEVGGYELGDVLGRGGMGEVVAAHDRHMEREVALKRMRDGAPSSEAVARFVREAKIQARLDHPAIVPVHELGRDDAGLPYFTMKRLAGTTLAARLAAGGPIQPPLRAFVDVCFAIELAHTRGVVHRDLKPSNIMLGDYGEVYVLDWGVARVIGTGAAAGEPPANLPIDSTAPDATATGALLGTPGYMAPEQMRGEDVRPAADVYSLGAILFELLAGEPLHPPGGAAIASTLQNAAGCSPMARAPSRAIAPELDAVCTAALAEDRDARPAAGELAKRVQAYLDGDRDLDHRRALAVESLALARTREAAGDRVGALRAAGRAVALDPESRDAGELATALMLTPTRDIPPEALRDLADTERELTRARGLRGARAYLLAWLFLPATLFLDVASWPILLGLVGGGTVMAGLVYLHGLGRVPTWVLVVANVAFGVLFERITGPLVLLPLFACIIAIAVGTVPGENVRWVVLAIVAVIVLTPVALELTGVLAGTWSVTPGGVIVHGTVFRGTQMADFIAMVCASIVLAMLVVAYALSMNRARQLAQRAAAIQAWHLKQLLPPPR